jgi:hypothetical protein
MQSVGSSHKRQVIYLIKNPFSFKFEFPKLK